jgi:ATP-dependent helicase/nuclease subunit A
MNASDPRLSAWVAANAGAGKTHTLASRVTRLLLAGARPERILCLTYTKAAAAEMAGRLFDQLGRWSMLPDRDLETEIRKIGDAPGGPEDLKRARRLFAKALETPGGLKIQTIHSFCQYVLTRFPLEAGVPAGFKVLDERFSRDLMNEARRLVLERAGTGDKTRTAAIAFLVSHLSDMKLETILDCALGSDRGKIDRVLEKTGGPENDWKALLNTAHGAHPRDTPETIAAEFRASLKTDDARLRETITWLSGGGKTDRKHAAGFAAALEARGDSDCFEGFRGVLLTEEGSPRALLATKKLVEARPDLLAYLQALCGRMHDCENRRRASHAAALAEAALTVIQAVREVYALEKQARNALDYDDLIVETHRLLQTNGSAWVLYKLDEGIDHILIDEAQDTSSLQWDIVQRLTEEFFAGEGAERPLRTLFAVGDEKQSIFSFQGADPAQFDVRRRYFAARAAEGRRELTEENLISSWRSAPEVLQFVDAVFADPAARDGLSSGEIKHEALKTNLKGCVEFWPALTPAKEDERDPWNLRPVDLERESGPVARLAITIAERIAGWIGKQNLPGHTEPIKPGDIMILLPRREPFGGEIIKRLKERGVKVAGADRLALTEQIAVMDLIALGRFALLPEDDLNLAALLRSPLIGISEEALFSLAHRRKGSLWRSLSERAGEFAEAHAYLSAMRAQADYAPPFEFYAEALTQVRRKLLKRLGSEAGDPIDEFLSLALQFENAQTPSLEGFLHWIERGGAEIKRDMERGRNEVRVMTVHGSKGLEADIVILPDTTRTPTDPTSKGRLLYTGDGMLFPLPDESAPERVRAARAAAVEEVFKEHRRLLYVALTRAKERLVICGFENKNGTQPGSWHNLAGEAAKALGTKSADGAHILGDPAFAPPAAETGRAAEKFTPPDWALTPAKPEHPAPWLIRPSAAAGEEEPAPPSPLAGASRFKRGLLVHAMLAHLPEAVREQRADIARRFLRANGVGAYDCEKLVAETLAVLDDPSFAPAFAPGSRAEVALVADLPELGPDARVHGRVDRLAATGDDVLIVDFKTGKPAAGETGLPVLYATQMALYRAAAERIFPGKRIACALVWTEGPVLMPLSAAFLDAETDRIRSRLDRARTGS